MTAFGGEADMPIALRNVRLWLMGSSFSDTLIGNNEFEHFWGLEGTVLDGRGGVDYASFLRRCFYYRGRHAVSRRTGRLFRRKRSQRPAARLRLFRGRVPAGTQQPTCSRATRRGDRGELPELVTKAS